MANTPLYWGILSVAVLASGLLELNVAIKSPDYDWVTVNVNGPIPSNAAIGGIVLPNNTEAGLTTYVVRAKLRSRYLIGRFYDPKVTRHWNAYLLGEDGREHTYSNAPFEMLVTSIPDQLRWIPASGGVIPQHAVHFSDESGFRRFLCRGISKGTPENVEVVVPGEVRLDEGWCRTFWFVPGIHIEYQVNGDDLSGAVHSYRCSLVKGTDGVKLENDYFLQRLFAPTGYLFGCNVLTSATIGQ